LHGYPYCQLCIGIYRHHGVAIRRKIHLWLDRTMHSNWPYRPIGSYVQYFMLVRSPRCEARVGVVLSLCIYDGTAIYADDLIESKFDRAIVGVRVHL
jgi:hypothetical protein